MESKVRILIDKIWMNFWENGITNPLTIIEQITYLLFIKQLDDREAENEKNNSFLNINKKRIFDEKHQICRWNQLKNKSAEEMYKIIKNEVFPFMKELADKEESCYTKYMKDAVFILPTPNILKKVVTAIDTLESTQTDIKGDIYEYLLSKLNQAGRNGQFRTPRHIVKMIIDLIEPTLKDIIIDPACGTAGFLVEASEFIRKNEKDNNDLNQEMFYGFETDATMLRIGAMNLKQHGIENANILYKDSLAEENADKNQYTLVLANPPFKGMVDSERISKDLIKITKTKKTELLFLALFLRILKIGGRCACIVPEGVLFGTSDAYVKMRKEIIENHELQAIIAMPAGVFKPYAGVSTSIILFKKTTTGGTNKVWFYDMKADGFTLDDQREKIKENDIPDIIKRFHNRDTKEEQERNRKEKSFFVNKEEIIKNNYVLTMKRYKEIIEEPEELEKPEEIIKRICSLEEILKQELKELGEML